MTNTSFLTIRSTASRVSPLEVLALNLLTASAYALSGYAGLKLAFIGHAVTLFWPPSGIAFAAIWLGGPRLAPSVVLGAFIVNLVAFHSPLLAALIAIGNLLPSLIGSVLLRRFVTLRDDPGELPRVVAFILIAALGTTVVSASIGTLAVFLSGQHATTQSTWLVWWMGDAMGVLIVAPPILLWRRIIRSGLHWRTVVDASGFAALGLGLIAGLLLIHNPIWAVEMCKLFTLLLSLWAGARFGLTGPAAMTLLMAFGAVGVTMLGVGPFVRGNFYDRFALVHSYLFAEAVAGMLLAAALADLQRAVARERLARGEAEAASANRIQLLNMISHDLRTPLSGIMGVLQTLARAPLAPSDARSVDLGLRAGTSLTKLTNDILDVARVDAGRITLDLAPFDPLVSLNDLIAMNSAAAAAKGVRLDLQQVNALPERLLGDRVRFEQMLGNLVTNAVTYTQVGCVAMTASWHADARALQVEVIDTGPGIDLVDASTVFDAFAGRAPVTKGTAGLGLGLHICWRLVTLMDGQISYSRRPEGGSRFIVSLPLSPADRSAEEVPSLTPTARRILVVEDDEIARETTVALLESDGHTATSAASADAAVEAVRSNVFDLVLMDVHLGGDRSGIDAARDIRNLGQPMSAVRIIALTGESADDSRAALRALGVDHICVKPVDLACIRSLLAAS
jgi:signal transduction histidine kinase/CheY-like chemotaxis protein